MFLVLIAEGKPKPVQTIECSDNKITCVTSLQSLVIAVRWNAQEKLDVYDAQTFTFQRHIGVPGLTKSFGLASSVTHNCLYASVFGTNKVCRVGVSGEVTNWSVGSYPMGVSVNDANNVIVACNHSHKLQEYTTYGSLVREIALPLKSPQHAVQLASGNFAVTNYDQVFVVDGNGTLVCSVKAASAIENHKNYPRGLQQLKNGRILVADTTGNRILMFDESMRHLGNIEGGLNAPWSVCLDESGHRLYISENAGGRLMVFSNFTCA